MCAEIADTVLSSAIIQNSTRYEAFSISFENSGEWFDITARHEKEAAELFCVYLWQKGVSKWLEET